jgi:hypothetical protein
MVKRRIFRRHTMTKFMLVIAAAAFCAPLAARAAVLATAPQAVTITAQNIGNAARIANLNEQVAVLSSQVRGLEQQNMGDTSYTAELSGIIPTGG